MEMKKTNIINIEVDYGIIIIIQMEGVVYMIIISYMV